MYIYLIFLETVTEIIIRAIIGLVVTKIKEEIIMKNIKGLHKVKRSLNNVLGFVILISLINFSGKSNKLKFVNIDIL